MIIDLEVRGLSNDNFKLTDHEGNGIAAQRIQSEATVNGQSRLLLWQICLPWGMRFSSCT